MFRTIYNALRTPYYRQYGLDALGLFCTEDPPLVQNSLQIDRSIGTHATMTMAVLRTHQYFYHISIEIRKQNIDTMNAISVDVEISDKLKKAKLENGFYNLRFRNQRIQLRHNKNPV